MLVYGWEGMLPISLEFPSLESAHQWEIIENNSMTVRMTKLIELEEKRQQVMQTLEIHQQQVKKSFDKKAKARVFKEGDLILKWDIDIDKLRRHSKFDAMWSGPNVITSYKEANAFQLSKPNGDIFPIPFNGIYLKT